MNDIDIKKLRFEKDLTQEELGKKLGITKQQVGRIEKGISGLTKENREILLNLYPDLQSNVEEIENCADIPVYGDVVASMGYGIRVYSENQTGTYSISRKLAQDIGINLKNSTMIFAKGDSMEPTIVGGDSLLIDATKKEVYDGSIYCVRIEGQLYAKRLQKLPPSTIVIISDNPKYESFKINLKKQIDFDFEIIGEIRWWGRVAR